MKSTTGRAVSTTTAILTSFLLVLILICISLNNGKMNIIPMLKGYLSVLLSGSLGETIHSEDVLPEVLIRFPRTLLLAILSLVIGAASGVLTGMLFSYGGSKRRIAQLLVNTVPVSLPDVLIIILLQYAMVILHNLNLPHFPVTGYGQPENLVLPVLSLSIIPCFYMARITYSYAFEAYNEKFVLTARAKGCPDVRIHWAHVWKRVRPQLTGSVYGLIPLLISNMLLVEKMFAYPGLSYNLFWAIKERDIYLFMGLTMGLAAVYSLLISLVWILGRLDNSYRRLENQ